VQRTTTWEVITFDCYGTLIDWETGIRDAFREDLEGLALSNSQKSRFFEVYQKEEKRIEAEKPYRSYREVLSEAAEAAAKEFSKNFPDRLSTILPERLPKWEPFPDTNPALERLAKNHSLGILSNVDDDLLADTLKQFTIKFDLLVTAEQVRSYKPGTKHFEEARKHIGTKRWLHAASSLYHDIDPASRLGLKTIWVNRKNSREGRKYLDRIVREVENLTQLADWLSP